MSNELIEKAIEILRQYAKETEAIVRATNDLSPLEEWLVKKLIEAKATIGNLLHIVYDYRSNENENNN